MKESREPCVCSSALMSFSFLFPTFDALSTFVCPSLSPNFSDIVVFYMYYDPRDFNQALSAVF